MKKCITCEVEKEPTEFSGRQTKCKFCFNQAARAKRLLVKTEPVKEGTKSCVDCNKELPFSDFYSGRNTCKGCHNKERREKYEKTVETANTSTKVCKVCNVEKLGDLFVPNLLTCKACFSEKNKEENHRPTETDPPKTCNKCNIEQPAVNYRYQEGTCKQCNQQKLYKWREENKEQFLLICKKYRETDNAKEVCRLYRNKKYREDIVFRLMGLYRTRVRTCIKQKYFPKNTAFDYATLLGCSWNFLIGWLEFNMKDTMTWENYGSLWHVDHVLPCASFDFSKEENRQRCFNWTNLMPLEGIENMKKSDSIVQKYIDYAKKRAIEYLTTNSDLIATILTDALPEDLRFLVTSGVLTTKGDEVKTPPGSGEISEVR